jgi:CheY-like chemotaxis protein
MSLQILVVDDEPLIRETLGFALAHHGFAVRLAAGGREAVEVFRQHHGAIAVVLLDVRMPGLDGPQTLAELRAIDPRVRCCFMSGHTGDYSAAELLARGAAHVFPKPFPDLAGLARALAKVAAR